MAIYTLERLRTSSCLIYGDGCWRIPGVPLFSAHIDTGKLKRVGSLTHINRGERWVGKNQRIALYVLMSGLLLQVLPTLLKGLSFLKIPF